MKPIGKYIVIETIEEQLKTKTGLLLTATDANEFIKQQRYLSQ